MNKTYFIATILIFSLCPYSYANNLTTWVGPITVIEEKFAKDGGIFGFIHSLHQGDCCHGGPEIEDDYPNQFKVDINGNIIVGDRELGKIHVFSKNSELISSFKKDNTTCNNSFYWPGYILVQNKKIVVETGWCTQVYDYQGKTLWNLETNNIYLDLKSLDNDKIIFEKYTKRPWPPPDDDPGVWHLYDLNGKYLDETTNYKKPVRISGNDVIANNITYRNIYKKYKRKLLKVDTNNNLYVFQTTRRKPENYEFINEFNIGTIDIYNSNTHKIHTVIFPNNKYSKTKRTCACEDYVAFAGRDIIEEYGKIFNIDKHGNIFTILCLSDRLRIVKWSPVNLSQQLKKPTIDNLNKEGLRILRNEIFARKGRVFKSKYLQDYFSKQPWYRPSQEYTDNLLSDIDKHNISLIQETEKALTKGST